MHKMHKVVTKIHEEISLKQFKIGTQMTLIGTDKTDFY